MRRVLEIDRRGHGGIDAGAKAVRAINRATFCCASSER
jgi:hypothetical protein